jgi:hypothetical protein
MIVRPVHALKLPSLILQLDSQGGQGKLAKKGNLNEGIRHNVSILQIPNSSTGNTTKKADYLGNSFFFLSRLFFTDSFFH